MKKRVMVVEDSQLIGLEIEELLESTNYEVVTCCSNGMEAISCYDKIQPDIVTMDIIMPEMDGLETARTIMDSYPDATIIMLSSLICDDSISEARQIGVKGFISKPFDQDQLVYAFDRALSKK